MTNGPGTSVDLAAAYGLDPDVLAALPVGPFELVNSFRRRDRATDEAGDDDGRSGVEAMLQYAAVRGPCLEAVGGRFLTQGIPAGRPAVPTGLRRPPCGGRGATGHRQHLHRRMTPPRQQRSAATVAAVVAAARELFGRRGSAAVSVDDVADECQRTKGAVYHHFATKQALFEEVFRREQRRLADDVVAASTSPDPVDSFTEGTARYLSLIAADPIARRITLLDAPSVLGWHEWRSCDGGPFRLLCAGALDRMA